MLIRNAVLSLLAIHMLAGPALAALDPATRCRISRLKLAARYASCLLVTDAKAVQSGTEADHTACDGKMQIKWASIEAKYGTECPTTNDVSLVQDVLSECAADALVPPASYQVEFRVPNSVSLGMLQFTVDYADASGEFAGSGSLVSCSNMLAGSIFAPDDTDASKSLVIGSISPTPSVTPATIARCTFDRAVYGLPDESEFHITVDTATDGNGDEVTASVEISAITPMP